MPFAWARGKGGHPLASLCLMGGDRQYDFKECIGCKLSKSLDDEKNRAYDCELYNYL